MKVQTKINDGVRTITRTYENVYRGVNLKQCREQFFSFEDSCQWGVMVQLRGHDRIVLGRFGTPDD